MDRLGLWLHTKALLVVYLLRLAGITSKQMVKLDLLANQWLSALSLAITRTFTRDRVDAPTWAEVVCVLHLHGQPRMNEWHEKVKSAMEPGAGNCGAGCTALYILAGDHLAQKLSESLLWCREPLW